MASSRGDFVPLSCSILEDNFLFPRLLRWLFSVAGIATFGSACVLAQIVPHPYTTLSRSERTLSEFIDDGMVRRAHHSLRTMQVDETSAAAQTIPFHSSAIARGSKQPSAAESAMSDFERSRSNTPEVPQARLMRGLAAIEEHNDELGAQHMDVAATLAGREFKRRDDSSYIPMEHFARFWQGASLARSGHFTEAIEAFELCIAVQPTGEYASDALHAIGQVYERNSDYEKAIATFGRVRSEYPTSEHANDARIREAQNNLVLRRPERAIDVLSGLESTDQVLLLRASALIIRGRHDLGLDTCNKLLANFPNSELRFLASLHAGFAELYLAKNEDAERHFAFVIDSIPDRSLPEYKQAQLYRALAYKRLGKLTEAEELLTELSVLPDYPYQAQAQLEAGQLAYERGAFDKAKDAFEKAERSSTDPSTTIRARLLLGSTLIEQQQWIKSAAVFERAEKFTLTADEAFVPQKQRYLAEARLKRGICLVQANDRKASIEALTDFLGNHPTDPQRDEATFWLAEAMYRADLLKNAQQLYDEIVTTYTASIRREEALYGLAWTYFRRREFVRSVEAFGALLKAYPNSRYATEALVRRGDGLYITKQFHAAAQQYDEAARRSPRSEEGQYAGFQAGHALYRAGELNESSVRLRAFTSSNPSSKLADDALFLTGWIEFQQRNDAGAITEFRRLLDAYPEGDQAVRALYTIADAQYNLGDINAAMETYRAVISRYPSHPLAAEAAKSMQIALMGEGRTQEALDIADTLINANPRSLVAEEFAFKKAEIFYSGRNYTSAAAELQAYLKKYPSSEKSDEALYLLGKTYLSMDDATQTTATYKELQKSYPQSRYVPLALMDLAVYFDAHADAGKADSLYNVVFDKHPDDTANASRAGFERATLSRVRGDTLRALGLYALNADRYAGTEYGNQSRYQVALYYRRSKIIDSAIFHLSILTRTAGDPLISANALHDIGDLYQREKRWSEAIEIFERVRTEYAGYEDWYTLSVLSLGNCYEQIQKFPEAKSAYAVIAELRPDYYYGKTAISRLKRLERNK